MQLAETLRRGFLPRTWPWLSMGSPAARQGRTPRRQLQAASAQRAGTWAGAPCPRPLPRGVSPPIGPAKPPGAHPQGSRRAGRAQLPQEHRESSALVKSEGVGLTGWAHAVGYGAGLQPACWSIQPGHRQASARRLCAPCGSSLLELLCQFPPSRRDQDPPRPRSIPSTIHPEHHETSLCFSDPDRSNRHVRPRGPPEAQRAGPLH
jgi:hypothetical protein